MNAVTTTARRPIVGGNWKMNTDLARAVELTEDIVAGITDLGELAVQVDVALFPPFPYLQPVGRALGHHTIQLGAQNVWPEPDGAFTGEVSTAMLADLDVEIVIVGHSERRHVIGESDELINRKLRAALDAELNAILCVGELREQRETGRAEQVVLDQLQAALLGVDPLSLPATDRLVIAYEPVWAIGTGLTATPEDAQKMHAVIRRWLAECYDDDLAAALRIQYGGSVKPDNADALFAQPDVDGFLVGGASLQADDFLRILASTLSRTASASSG